MDTSHVYLVLALIKDDQLIAKYSAECWKKQSEEIFVRLIEMCEKVNVTPEMIDQICISKGPGSYTGVRIAMTVAKVFCAMKNVPLYTIGTLQLYAGNRSCRVIMDARSKGHIQMSLKTEIRLPKTACLSAMRLRSLSKMKM